MLGSTKQNGKKKVFPVLKSLKKILVATVDLVMYLNVPSNNEK